MFYDNSPSSVKCIREISICAVRKLSRMIRKEIVQGTVRSSSYPDSAEYVANLLALSLFKPLLQPHLQLQYNLCKSISGFPTDWPCGLCCRWINHLHPLSWNFRKQALNDPTLSFTMMTSSNGNIFRVTGHLCGEITGPRWIPHTKASDTSLIV